MSIELEHFKLISHLVELIDNEARKIKATAGLMHEHRVFRGAFLQEIRIQCNDLIDLADRCELAMIAADKDADKDIQKNGWPKA